MSNGEPDADDLEDNDDSSVVKCSAHVKLNWAPTLHVTGTTRKNQTSSLKALDVPVMFRKAKGKAPVFTAHVVGIIEDEHGIPHEVVVSEYALFMNGTTGKLELKSLDKDINHVPPKFVEALVARPGQIRVASADVEEEEEDDDDDDDEELDEEFDEEDDDEDDDE